MSVRRRLSILGALVGMVGLLLVATSGGVGANPAVPSDATLTLSVAGNGGSWSLDATGETQILGKTGACELTTQSGPVLVETTGVSDPGTGAYAGIRKGAIGTFDVTEGNGEPCARVDTPRQSLVLALGSSVTDTYLASGGQIALRFKFNAIATIKMYEGGLGGTNVDTKVFACTGGNDCGPDSGLSDVTEIPLDTLPSGARFDTLEITSTGAVSLVSTAAKETHLHLALIPTYTVSGMKFHDRDTDWDKDLTSDEELAGWQIHAFSGTDHVTSATTGDIPDTSDGYYELTLAAGTYTICEEVQPLSGPLDWSQVPVGPNTAEPDSYVTGACDGLTLPFAGDPLGSDGHVLTVAADTEDIDFANVIAAVYACTGFPESATIVQSENLPGSTLTVTCGKAGGITVPFDVGANPDEGATQFVTVGLDPQGNNVQEQIIFWAEETADYDENNVLQVKTTKVIFEVGGTPVDVEFCDNGDPQPAPGNPHCLDAQVIELGNAPGNSVSDGNMQLTEYYRYLGDPSNFR